MPRRKRILIGVLTCIAALAFPLMEGCSSVLPNRDPTGQIFPPVVGRTLEKKRIELPFALAGSPSVLLVGYRQRTQFDIDRWIMGLIQAKLNADIVEIPTIPGLVPSFVSGWINEGMRAGIPREDWGSVVTLYGAAAKPVAELTGNENGQNARVIVLDRTGTIVWFDDTGYSSRKALEVAGIVLRMSAGEQPRE